MYGVCQCFEALDVLDVSLLKTKMFWAYLCISEGQNVLSVSLPWRSRHTESISALKTQEVLGVSLPGRLSHIWGLSVPRFVRCTGSVCPEDQYLRVYLCPENQVHMQNISLPRKTIKMCTTCLCLTVDDTLGRSLISWPSYGEPVFTQKVRTI